MTKVSATIPSDVLSRTFAALADPTRRSILEQLSLGPASVTDLRKPYPISQPAMSKHIKVLELAGLVTQEPGSRLGRRQLELGTFVRASAWMEAYARIWEVRLNHFNPKQRTTSEKAKSARKIKT
jgi:DNA-binding transcriptional ArsR family regulator